MASMTDPFFCLLIAHQLGSGYRVWDTQGHIVFRTPDTVRLRATFVVTDETVAAIREATAEGQKHLRWFRTDIVDGIPAPSSRRCPARGLRPQDPSHGVRAGTSRGPPGTRHDTLGDGPRVRIANTTDATTPTAATTGWPV